MYGMRFPVTARSRDDPRLLGWRMVDGKSQALQQRHLAELEAEGRKMKDLILHLPALRLQFGQINRRRTRRDRGCWRPLRTLMRCKQQRSLRKSRRRRRESGFEKDLVGISHDWVSNWPSTSTTWQFHPHQTNFPTTRKRC